MDEDWPYSFACECYAPAGFEPLRPWLPEAQLQLTLYVSGYNGRTILRGGTDTVELNMDASDDDLFFASGFLKLPEQEALAWIAGLHAWLVRAGIPHELKLDDAAGTTHKRAHQPERLAAYRHSRPKP